MKKYQDDNKVICGIYSIQNKINQKRYIGKAIDIYARWDQHITFLTHKDFKCENDHLIYSWHRYGADNFEFTILEECDESQLSEREKYWIKYYDARKNGYNQTDGGSGGNTRIAYTGKKLEEHKKKVHEARLRSALRGEEVHFAKLTKDDVFKIIERFQNGDSDGVIAKDYNVDISSISAIRKHRSWKDLTVGLDLGVSKVINEKYCCSVDMYDQDGKMIKTYDTFYDIKKEYPKFNIQTIYHVCIGEYTTSYGFIWRYHGHDFYEFNVNKKNRIQIDQYDLNWNYIATYKSIADANKQLNTCTINDAFRKESHYASGYYWLRHGETPPENHERLVNKSCWVSIDQYDNNMQFIKTYESISQASIDLHICDNTIHRALKNKKIKAGGFYWRYHDSNYEKTKKKTNNIAQQKPVNQYDKQWNLIKTYESITQAGEENNICFSNIISVLKGRGKTAGGFHWTYKDNDT